METIRFFAEIIRLLEFPHSILFLTFCCFLSKKIGPEKNLSFWVKSLNWKSMVSLTKLKKGEHDLQHEDVSFLIQRVLLPCFLFFLKSSLFKFGLHLPYNTHETTNVLFNSHLHNVKVPHKVIRKFSEIVREKIFCQHWDLKPGPSGSHLIHHKDLNISNTHFW